jgi:hypothetical protein
VLDFSHYPARRRKSTPDRRTVQFHDVIKAAGIFPGVPSIRRWSQRPTVPPTPMSWPMLLNDRIGCCTATALGHGDAVVAEHNHLARAVNDEVVERAYMDVGGYVPVNYHNPTTNDTDGGASMLEMLRYFRRLGVVKSYAEIDPHNLAHVELAIDLCGGIYAGFDLPVAWQRMAIWDSAPVGGRTSDFDRNSWGGHATWPCDYDQTGLWLPTWGGLKRVTRSGFLSYVDECYVVQFTRWQTEDGSPSGYVAAALDSLVSRIAA